MPAVSKFNLSQCSWALEILHIRYQVSGNLILPGEPLAIGYFVAPSKEKKMYTIKLKVKVSIYSSYALLVHFP